MNKRIDIQILRALAVIFVVLFHLDIAGVKSGFLGVDVFFVVSGFLMAILYKKGEAKKFFERRAKRLLPAYFATIILTVFFALFLVLPSELGQVTTQSIYSLFFANNIGFCLQNSYFSASEFSPLLHLWSLGVEIQFYLIVPLLVFFFSKSRFYLFIALSISFIACVYVVGIYPNFSFFLMPLRLWEFLIGFVVAYYLTNNGLVKYHNFKWLGVIGLVILCTIPFIYIDGQTLNRLEGHPSFYALLVCIATSLVLGFGLPQVFEKNVICRFFAKIGDYSYSIYLVHFPIIVLYLYKPFSGTILHPGSYMDKFNLFILIMIFSVVLHKFIEQIKINAIGKLYITSLAAVVLLIGAAQIAPAMYSQKDQNIFNGVSDRAIYRCGKMGRITDRASISCKINSNNFDQSILLVGNSHADAIKMAFSGVASSLKYNTYFMVSNTPLMDSSVTPEILINEANRLKIKILVLHYSPDSVKIETIKNLMDLAKKNEIVVNFILPVPVYRESVPKMIYDNNLAERYDANKYLQNNAVFISGMRKLATEYDDLKVYDTYQVFCHSECAISDIEKHPFYFDSGHLTLTGSKILKPVFEKII